MPLVVEIQIFEPQILLLIKILESRTPKNESCAQVISTFNRAEVITENRRPVT